MKRSELRILGCVIGILVLGSGILLARRHFSMAQFQVQSPVSTGYRTTTPNPTLVPPKIVVQLAGAVHHPGVYEATPNIRVLAFLKTAGGVLPQADLDKVKLAARLKDGQRILVPYRKKPKGSSKSSRSKSGPLSINTATYSQWVQVRGIGPKTARAILSYRQTHGRFNTVDELTNVKGIGPKTLEKLKPYLTL